MFPQIPTALYSYGQLGIAGTQLTGPLHLGIQVERAAASLPAAATLTPLFTISGGRVLFTILGEVTTVIQTQANATKLVHNPTVGADQDLCTTLDITADILGTLYTLPAAFASALIGSGMAAPFPGMGTPIIAKPGTIDLHCAATNTGAVRWTLFYLPLDLGAAVVAA